MIRSQANNTLQYLWCLAEFGHNKMADDGGWILRNQTPGRVVKELFSHLEMISCTILVARHPHAVGLFFTNLFLQSFSCTKQTLNRQRLFDRRLTLAANIFIQSRWEPRRMFGKKIDPSQEFWAKVLNRSTYRGCWLLQLYCWEKSLSLSLSLSLPLLGISYILLLWRMMHIGHRPLMDAVP